MKNFILNIVCKILIDEFKLPLNDIKKFESIKKIHPIRELNMILFV